MLWTIVAMFTIIWGIPLALSAFGVSSQTIFAVIVPLGLAWMLIGGIRSFMIACPSCGKSLFMRGFISVPWPAKRCSRFGAAYVTAQEVGRKWLRGDSEFDSPC
jgi:hypothetical protein